MKGNEGLHAQFEDLVGSKPWTLNTKFTLIPKPYTLGLTLKFQPLTLSPLRLTSRERLNFRGKPCQLTCQQAKIAK